MESDSDEDFLSADEGDDDIVILSITENEHEKESLGPSEDKGQNNYLAQDISCSNAQQRKDSNKAFTKKYMVEENISGHASEIYFKDSEVIGKSNKSCSDLGDTVVKYDFKDGSINATNMGSVNELIGDVILEIDEITFKNVNGKTSSEKKPNDFIVMDNSSFEKEHCADNIRIEEVLHDEPSGSISDVHMDIEEDQTTYDPTSRFVLSVVSSDDEEDAVPKHDEHCEEPDENKGNKECTSENNVKGKKSFEGKSFSNGIQKNHDGNHDVGVVHDGDRSCGGVESSSKEALIEEKSRVKCGDAMTLLKKESSIDENDIKKFNKNDKGEDISCKEAIDRIDSTGEESWGWKWADNFISHAATKATSLIEHVEGQFPDLSEVAITRKAIEQTAEETLACKNDLKKNADAQARGDTSSWFASVVPPVASIANLVQSKGQDLMTGGIDALEFIGKSTVNYLSDGDPGLRKTREAIFKNKGSTLSAVILEAKLKAEERGDCGFLLKGEDPKKLNDMLEKFQAIAHLDALEMLSSECSNKLGSILNVQSDLAKTDSMVRLMSIRDSFELEEAEQTHEQDIDFKKEIFSTTKKLQLKITCSKLLNVWSKLQVRTKDLSSIKNREICFESFISSLAELISRCVEYYRKVADMLMLTDIQANELAVERATMLKKISEMFLCEISNLVNKFASFLGEESDNESPDFITDIYLESSNASSLLHDSHMLLLPIIQCSAIK